MTRLRPLVVPVAALTLATAAPSAASAQQRRPVETWADSPAALVAQHADLPSSHAALIPPATSLPLADLGTPEGEATIPDGRSAVVAPPAAAPAAGRPILHTARGPP